MSGLLDLLRRPVVVAPVAGGPTTVSLAAALASAARVGDEVGEAGAGRAMAVLGDAGPEVVAALVGRLRAVLPAEGGEPPAIETATGRLPDETVDPDEAWRLATEHLAGGERAGATEAGHFPSELELELRALPALVSFGTAPGRAD